MTLFLLATSVIAQAGGKVLVQCTDSNKRPVADAEVWIWQSRLLPGGGGELIGKGPFTTRTDGSVRTVVATTNAGGSFDRWVYARVANKLVGAIRAAKFASAKSTDAITVTMLPSREIRGRITVPEGSDPSKVIVRTLGLSGAIGDNWWAQTFPRQSGIASLSNSLPQRFDTQTAADGTFALKDFPVRALVYLAAEGEGLGQAQWFNALRKGRDIPELIEMTLHPECVVSGIVRGPDDRPLPATTVMLQRLEGGVQMTWTTKSDGEGRYRFVGLAGGKHRLKVKSAVGVMRAKNLSLIRGKASEGHELVVERGVLVRGVVRDQLRKPVEGVGIGAIDPDPWGKRIYLGSGSTDPQGQFEIRLPTGPAELYFSGVPEGFTYPEPQTVAEIDVAAGDAALGKLELTVTRAK